KRQTLNTLCGPLGADFPAGYAPDFLRISLKEDTVEALAEPVGNPLLERLFGFLWQHLGLEVAQKDEDAVPDTKGEERVPGAKRVIEEFLVVVDSRKAAAAKKVFLVKYLAPHRFDDLDFGEEAVTADVETITFVVDCPRKSADDPILFEHDRGNAGLTK